MVLISGGQLPDPKYEKESTDEVAGLVSEEGDDADISGGLKEDVIAGRDQHLQSLGDQVLGSCSNGYNKILGGCVLDALQFLQPAVQLWDSVLLGTRGKGGN